MNVTLSGELDDLVRNQLESGRYDSADQVLLDAVRRLETPGNNGGKLSVDRDRFMVTLGNPDEVAAMDSEAKADAFEEFLSTELDEMLTSKDTNFPTVAEVEARIETRHYRMGVGNLFVAPRPGSKVRRLPKMPAKPSLADFFERRFGPANHVLQSAALAMKNGLSDEIVLACLLHDTAQALMKVDHGYWAAHMYEPYVPEKTAFAIRYHQALRFFPDPEYGYEYPDLYRRLFGEDYVPAPHVRADYEMVRRHKWYFEARMVTVNDLYSFDPNAKVTLEPFVDIIGRHFRQPAEGLGNDGTPVAHIWRSIANPDSPL